MDDNLILPNEVHIEGSTKEDSEVIKDEESPQGQIFKSRADKDFLEE